MLIVHDDFKALDLVTIHRSYPPQEGSVLIELKHLLSLSVYALAAALIL